MEHRIEYDFLDFISYTQFNCIEILRLWSEMSRVRDPSAQNLWNNPSTPPEKIYVIYKHRINGIDEAANPPSWYHWSNRLQGQARHDAEVSNYRSGWGRIQAAIKTQADADRFDAYLEGQQ